MNHCLFTKCFHNEILIIWLFSFNVHFNYFCYNHHYLILLLLFSIKYPMEHGIVTDWNDMERIWQYIYRKERINIWYFSFSAMLRLKSALKRGWFSFLNDWMGKIMEENRLIYKMCFQYFLEFFSQLIFIYKIFTI